MIAPLRNILRRLFGTPAAARAADARPARLVNALFWVTLIGALGFLVVQFTGAAGRVALFALLMVLLFLLPSRWLLGRGRVGPAGALLVAGFFISTTLAVAAAGGMRPTFYVVYLFTIISSTLILGRRVGLATAVAVAAVGYITILLTGQTTLIDSGDVMRPGALATSLAIGALLFTAVVYLSDQSITHALEAAARSEGALQELTAGLEARVAEQTRDLRLAGEIGQTVAQIRDLDRLLERAVNLIRDRFDLYFTQIYLPDTAGRNLVMRAGTGEVGQKLLERGHRLPLTLDSINGTAAVEKQAVVVADTAASPVFRPNELLPQTRSEMAVPLVAAERVVGVLNLQSAAAGALSESMLPVFEALAGQLAVAIENAGLFATARSAREELAAQSRRLVDAGWRNFLDGIERREQLGFTYDRVAIFPVVDPEKLDEQRATVAAPISVAGRQVGRIQIQTADGESLPPADLELVDFVAQQVAQQVESLRLLAEAEKYRAEAEHIVRQATRDAWDAFQEQQGSSSYLYDGQQVVGAVDLDGADLVARPLTVLGEEIGDLAIPADLLLSPEAATLVDTVAERLSVHLENLRLTQQTENALVQTEALYQGSDRVVRATSIHQTLEALISSTALQNYDWSSVAFFDQPWGDKPPQSMTIMSTMTRDDRRPLPPGLRPGTTYDAAVWASVLQRNLPTLFEDVLNSPDATPDILQVAQALNLRGLVFFPLLAGGSWYGVVTGQSIEPVQLGDDDLRRLNSLVDQAGTVIQGLRLLSDAQRRAEHERRVRAVTDKIRRGGDRESILRIAREEIGQLLEAQQGRIQLGSRQQLLSGLRAGEENGDSSSPSTGRRNGS